MPHHEKCLYRQEGLQVSINRRKKLASAVRVKAPCASRVNERWTMDFVADALTNGVIESGLNPVT